MQTKSSNDDATGKRLWLLVGLVVVLGVIFVSAIEIYGFRRPQPLAYPVVLLPYVAVLVLANRIKVYARVRSTVWLITWGDVGVIVGFVLLPAPWVVLCTVLSAAILKTAVPWSGVQKASFAVGKEGVTAAASGAVFLIWGVQPSLTHPQFAIGAITVAFLVNLLTDHVVYMLLIAILTHTTIRRAAFGNWESVLVGAAIRLATTVAVIGVLASGADPMYLLAIPLLIASMHLWQSRNVRTREERESWQRLARATDELNAVDITQVLHAAVNRATEIFSAASAEIDLNLGGNDRVVRGTATAITSDGPSTETPREDPHDVTTVLATHKGDLQVGTLRLSFGGSVKLTEFEQYKLKTFASALCTAIRNAFAYAELGRMNAQNAFDAAHDPLTGLANRRALYEKAADQFREKTDDGVAALLLIDLNHFKEVNDTLGHAAGDAVLRQVATRLSDAATDKDLVSRLGGDEFAVLLSSLATPALATHRAAALLAALEDAIEVEGMAIIVEAAAGIALAPGSGGINELMRRADVAMYQAKRGGGQQIVTYTHGHDSADVGRLLLGGELQRAVAEHEFVVDFQPIVDLGSGEAISVEALARWQHPEHGHLTPIQFLETVERSGQLPAFAGAVLDQALTSAVIWRDSGFDLPVSVNVSPRSLLDPRFPDDVLARLERHAVPPAKLVLELAETLTISQLDVVSRALSELRDAGVQLALDDFGTGVSPLSVLSRVPVHQLKIDREFVTAIETSSEASAVIRSTVDLARSLHLTVIAEGVESEPQRLALWELGCVAGQGHLFARPVSSARLLAALQRGSSGRPGALAAALHDAGSVVRMPQRRSPANGRGSLPHLRA